MGDKKDKDNEKGRKKAANKSASATAAGKDLLERLEDTGYATGYETDAGTSNPSKRKPRLRKKTTKASSGDAGYETDDGYVSSSQPSKPKGKSSRFFKLGNKSKTNVDEEPTPLADAPPVPAFRVPIAARFATTLGNLDATGSVEPPLGPPALPPVVTSPSQNPSTGVPSKPMSPEATDAAPSSFLPSSKRTGGVHFHSDSSDHHISGGSSSAGGSLFSRAASSSSSSPTTSSSVMSHAQSKPAMVPMPLTRSVSPPSNAPVIKSSKSGVRHVPDPLKLPTQGQDMSSSISPFVVVTPNDPSAPLPSESVPSSSTKSKRTGLFNKPSSAKAQAPLVISAPIRPSDSKSHNLGFGKPRSPQPPGTEPLIIQDPVIRVPSPRSTSLEPPLNTYSYYELPPPSPPPDAPLPRAPTSGYESASNLAPENIRHLRAPRTVSPLGVRPVSPSAMAPPKRGKESPFPVAVKPSTGRVPGLEQRVTRYRDLYGIPHPEKHGNGNQSAIPASNPYHPDMDPAPPAVYRTRSNDTDYHSQPSKARPQRFGVRFEDPDTTGLNIHGASDDEDWGVGYDDDDDEIRAVANRFDGGAGRKRNEQEPALGRSTSFEALRDRYQDASTTGRLGSAPGAPGQEPYNDDRSYYPNDEMGYDRSTIYTIRNSSAGDLSIDNRLSIMDQEKSERSRDRFVRRIEAMFDANGRELPPRNAVPPVPKIPQGIGAAAPVVKGGWF